MPNGDKRTAESAKGSKHKQFLSEQQQHAEMQGGRAFGETTGQNWAFGCEAAVFACRQQVRSCFTHVDTQIYSSQHTGFVSTELCCGEATLWLWKAKGDADLAVPGCSWEQSHVPT